MIIDVNKLPKKFNEVNYFKKTEKGCEIYSYAQNIADRNDVVVVELNGFNIEKDFCVGNKALDMLRVLNADDITITDNSFIIKSKKGKYTAKLMSENLLNMDLENEDNFIATNIDILVKASQYASKDGKKPILMGVRLDTNSNVYATDSFKAYLYANMVFADSGITLPITFIKMLKN